MATKDLKTSELPKADPVTVGPTDPYPVGSPPDNLEVVARVHPPQARTDAEHWNPQAEANLAAAGVIAGAEAYVPPEPPEPEEDSRAGLRSKGWKLGGKKPSPKGK